jgi:hypothetical protein
MYRKFSLKNVSSFTVIDPFTAGLGTEVFEVILSENGEIKSIGTFVLTNTVSLLFS